MIEIQPRLWLGNWEDACRATVDTTVLNVCCDLFLEYEHAKVGLVDGPGNSLATYHAAALSLWSLMQNVGDVLVVDHERGGRCVTVAIMYLHLTRRMGWDHWLGVINGMQDHVAPHEAHRAAFNKINWRLLNSVIGD